MAYGNVFLMLESIYFIDVCVKKWGNGDLRRNQVCANGDSRIK